MALASPTQPLVLADGTKIDPTSGEIIREIEEVVEIPTNVETQRELARVRRTIKDLPELPEKMNVVSAILSYELFGLTPRDIAVAIGLGAEQIREIQQTETYSVYRQDIIRRFAETEAETVRDLLAQKAMNAANRVINLMENTNNEGLQLKAAQDVLDRSGNRPADVVLHKHSMDGELRITMIDGKDNIPKHNIIDVTPQ